MVFVFKLLTLANRVNREKLIKIDISTIYVGS